jgi:hypothetical protein
VKRLVNLLTATPWGAVLLGGVFFFSVFGVGILDPTHTAWLMNNDPGQHFMGWHIFRHEEWHFPPGRIAHFGIPDGSSIIFTDSLPLLAFPFKWIGSFLPDPFQYFGLWILLCYLLQGYFGWHVSSRVLQNPFQRLLLSAFFILSPSLLFRGTGHHSLMGHWTLLAALDLSLRPHPIDDQAARTHFPWKAWTVLLSVTALIHLYLLAAVSTLFLASLFSFRRPGQPLHRMFPITAAIPLCGALIAMILEGCFIVDSHNWKIGDPKDYYHYSMNLLSPFFPPNLKGEAFSGFLSVHPLWMPAVSVANDNQYEGFNYLGLGVILLGVLAILLASRGGINATRLRRLAAALRPHAYLILALALLTLFAITPQATWGPFTLWREPLRRSMLEKFSVFRASGRFFWAPSYALLLITAWELGRLFSLRPRWLTLLLLIALGFQITDLSPYHRWMREDSRRIRSFSNPFTGEVWSDFFQGKKEILYYPTEGSAYYVPLGFIAAQDDMGMNVGYKARYDAVTQSRFQETIREAWLDGNIRKDSAYITRDKDLYLRLREFQNPHIVVGERDGFYTAYWKD